MLGENVSQSSFEKRKFELVSVLFLFFFFAASRLRKKEGTAFDPVCDIPAFVTGKLHLRSPNNALVSEIQEKNERGGVQLCKRNNNANIKKK